MYCKIFSNPPSQYFKRTTILRDSYAQTEVPGPCSPPRQDKKITSFQPAWLIRCPTSRQHPDLQFNYWQYLGGTWAIRRWSTEGRPRISEQKHCRAPRFFRTVSLLVAKYTQRFQILDQKESDKTKESRDRKNSVTINRRGWHAWCCPI